MIRSPLVAPLISSMRLMARFAVCGSKFQARPYQGDGHASRKVESHESLAAQSADYPFHAELEIETIKASGAISATEKKAEAA